VCKFKRHTLWLDSHIKMTTGLGYIREENESGKSVQSLTMPMSQAQHYDTWG